MEHRVKLPASLTSINVNTYYNDLIEIVKKSSVETKLKIDFDDVNFIDSSGVIAVNDIKDKAEGKNISVELINVKPTVVKTLELFGKKDSEQLTQPGKIGYLEQAGNTFLWDDSVCKRFYSSACRFFILGRVWII